MRVKYIVVKEPVFGMEVPVTFPEVIPHPTVEIKNGQVVSAGFYSATLGAYGGSTGLGLNSRPQDTELIRTHIGI